MDDAALPAASGLPHDEWQARVTAGRRVFPTLSGVYGTIRVADGVVEFVPDGSPVALWQVPATSVTVTQRGYFASSDLSLNTPATGEVAVTVSRERIRRVLGSEGRERRQRLYADEFLGALVLSGATLR